MKKFNYNWRLKENKENIKKFGSPDIERKK